MAQKPPPMRIAGETSAAEFAAAHMYATGFAIIAVLILMAMLCAYVHRRRTRAKQRDGRSR